MAKDDTIDTVGTPTELAPTPSHIPMITIELLRDYWFVEDVRTKAGTRVDVDQDAAKIAIDAGLASFVAVASGGAV